MNVQDSINLLGLPVEDKVTGFKGIAESVSFDLYGCIQVVIRPPVNKDNNKEDGHWFDVDRIKITAKKPVMNVPSFVKIKGPATKSVPN